MGRKLSKNNSGGTDMQWMSYEQTETAKKTVTQKQNFLGGGDSIAAHSPVWSAGWGRDRGLLLWSLGWSWTWGCTGSSVWGRIHSDRLGGSDPGSGPSAPRASGSSEPLHSTESGVSNTAHSCQWKTFQHQWITSLCCGVAAICRNESEYYICLALTDHIMLFKWIALICCSQSSILASSLEY